MNISRTSFNETFAGRLCQVVALAWIAVNHAGSPSLAAEGPDKNAICLSSVSINGRTFGVLDIQEKALDAQYVCYYGEEGGNPVAGVHYDYSMVYPREDGSISFCDRDQSSVGAESLLSQLFDLHVYLPGRIDNAASRRGEALQKAEAAGFAAKCNIDIDTTADAEDAPIGCAGDDAFDAVKVRYDLLERIKTDRELFELDVVHEDDPFEICIKDGKATLKVAPNAGQELAGFTASTLSGTLSKRVFISGAADKAGKLARDNVAAYLKERQARKAVQLTTWAIKDMMRNADTMQEYTKSAVTKALKPLAPADVAVAGIVELINLGDMTTSPERGLEIYTELQVAADLARANSKAAFCKLVSVQIHTANQIVEVGNKIVGKKLTLCQREPQQSHRQLAEMLEKLRHDISHIGGESGYVPEMGWNWTFGTQYGKLNCVRNNTATIPRMKTFR